MAELLRKFSIICTGILITAHCSIPESSDLKNDMISEPYAETACDDESPEYSEKDEFSPDSILKSHGSSCINSSECEGGLCQIGRAHV